jgi:cytoskeletal protein CcmA (bactofilin family)
MLFLSLSLMAAFMLPTPALANEIVIEETVGKGQVMDKNLVLAGTDVSMEGVVNGDLLVIGDEVTLSGEINGSLIVIGKQVLLDGPLSGSAYIAAQSLELGPQANVGRDVFFVGGRIDTQETAIINRDLNVISLEASLNGTTGREVTALVGPLNLIQGLVGMFSNQNWFPKPLLMNTPLPQLSLDPQTARGMAFGLQPIPHSLLSAGEALPADAQESTTDAEAWKATWLPFLRTLVSLLLIGLLLVWLVPAQTGWAGEQVRTHPWKALGLGLVVFVIGWLAAVLLLLVFLGLGVFFYWVSMPNLGFLVASLGLTTLGLAVTVFWLSIMYFSKIIVAYLVGKLLFKRFIPKLAQGRVLPLITGILLYALLVSIPYLGWVIAVITTLLGLGALWMTSGWRKRSALEPAVEVPPAEAEPELSLQPQE